MVFAGENPWKGTVVVGACSYFDDSGTHQASVVTIIGGFVATTAVWKQVERSWIEPENSDALGGGNVTPPTSDFRIFYRKATSMPSGLRYQMKIGER